MGLLMHFKIRGVAQVTEKKKAEPEFFPKVIEDGSDDKPYFFAFIPNQIEPNDNRDQRLVGFPLNILFGGITLDPQTGRESVVHVCYAPAPETYRETSARKEMRYFTKPKSTYSIRVICEKPTDRWRTEKVSGKKLIRTAVASTFDQALIHATMGGVEADEY